MKEPVRLVFTMLVSVVVLFSFQILYTNYSNRKSDQRWCDLMVGLDDRYQALDTKDPDAIKFRNDVHKLRGSLQCPPAGPPQDKSPTP